MTTKKSSSTPATVEANDPDDRQGAPKHIGGSRSDRWNNTLADQAVQALWMKNSEEAERERQLNTTTTASLQFKPAIRKNLAHSLPKLSSPGSLHLDYTRCGKPTCRCARGLLHGPYVYRRWRHGGRQRKAYVPMHDLPRVLAEMERQRAMVARPRQMKRILKELRDAK